MTPLCQWVVNAVAFGLIVVGLVDVLKGFFGDVVIQFLALVVKVVNACSDFVALVSSSAIRSSTDLFPDSTRPAALILGPMRKQCHLLSGLYYSGKT